MKAEQDVVLPMKISFATDPALLKDAVTTIGPDADDVLVRLSSRQMQIVLTDAIEVVVTVPLKRPTGLSEDGNLELQISINAFAGLDDLAESDEDIEFSIPHFKQAVGDEGRIEIRTGTTTIMWFYVLLGTDITPATSTMIHSVPVNTDALRRSLQLVRSFAKKSDTNPIFSIMSVSDSAALAGAASLFEPFIWTPSSKSIFGSNMHTATALSHFLDALQVRISRSLMTAGIRSFRTIIFPVQFL
ncbi:MAG: hypothetical protein EKK40_13830 [Bradyrhizobiaceae bacterium]|nr:MAG: hypothetical protein EKK40_13830 [Bradyrhizobiaceae bacterium]